MAKKKISRTTVKTTSKTTKSSSKSSSRRKSSQAVDLVSRRHHTYIQSDAVEKLFLYLTSLTFTLPPIYKLGPCSLRLHWNLSVNSIINKIIQRSPAKKKWNIFSIHRSLFQPKLPERPEEEQNHPPPRQSRTSIYSPLAQLSKKKKNSLSQKPQMELSTNSNRTNSYNSHPKIAKDSEMSSIFQTLPNNLFFIHYV